LQKSSGSNKKGRPRFEQHLAKYKKKGATQKQKRRPSKAKDIKASLGHHEQPDSLTHQGNHAAAP